MKKSVIKILFFLIVLFGAIICQLSPFKGDALCMGSNKVPTAVVLDAETGKPIEGAVAIAIWRVDNKDGPWFEGGGLVAGRIEEAVSDKEGKIYIDDFWDWHLFELSHPRLTIYKPGYICWDQKNIYIDRFHSQERKDFDKENRILRMNQWPENFSFISHDGFVDSVTQGEAYKAKQNLFRKAFDYESPFFIQEMDKRHKVHGEKKRRIK